MDVRFKPMSAAALEGAPREKLIAYIRALENGVAALYQAERDRAKAQESGRRQRIRMFYMSSEN